MKKNDFYWWLFFWLLIAAIVIFSSCTENTRVKHFGGTMTLELKPNEKLINITWKESQMWVLTEDTVTHYKYFREKSSWGIWQGEVIIKP
jgi:hypothetical protein